MDDLIKRLEIKAGVMEMGERIAWGSDTMLMREACRSLGVMADHITALEAELERVRAEYIKRPVIDWIGTDAPDPRDAYTTRINGHVVGIHSQEESARNHAWRLEAYIEDSAKGAEVSDD